MNEENSSLSLNDGMVGTHRHIKGLGLDSNLKAVEQKDGMVGQLKAREAAGLIVQIVKRGALSGRLVILAGPPGSGKTALAIAVAKELGKHTPFVHLSASEIYGAKLKKTEVLYNAIRSCIGVEIIHEVPIFEGIVEKIDMFSIPVSQQDPHKPGPDGIRIQLKAGGEVRTVETGMNTAMQVLKNKVRLGERVRIDELSGKVKVVNQSEDSTATVKNEGVAEVLNRVDSVSLSELDAYASRVYSDGVFAVVDNTSSGRELSPNIRSSVDEEIGRWLKRGIAKIKPGVLFIDDAHILDIESLAALNKAAEGEIAPIIFLATNRGVTKIVGTDIESPMGLPRDVIDRAVIIPTGSYKLEEMKKILEIQAIEEQIEANQDANDFLGTIASKTSLRYAIQVQSLAAQLAKSKGEKKVSQQEMAKVAGLFMDVGDIVKHLRLYEDKMLK